MYPCVFYKQQWQKRQEQRLNHEPLWQLVSMAGDAPSQARLCLTFFFPAFSPPGCILAKNSSSSMALGFREDPDAVWTIAVEQPVDPPTTGPNIAAIVDGVVGAVVGLAFIAGGLYYLHIRATKKKAGREIRVEEKGAVVAIREGTAAIGNKT
jgi:hypothetical protein